jgi:hypothetical protein
MSDQWETFCDVGYYHMWRLRRKTERGWNDGFHINTRDEAEGLCELLNKLEGELTEAREQRDRLAEEIENLKASGIHTCHDQCKRPMCVMRRERERYKIALDKYSEDEATNTLLGLKEQRDRLAEACKLLMRVIGDPAENWWPTEDEVNAAWNSGSEALAAWKGGSDEISNS